MTGGVMDPNEATRYPLAWPAGWPRTARHARRAAAFRTQVLGASGLAVRRLADGLGRLRAVGEVLSTNLQTRLDGLPRSGQAEPEDPGASVYFRLKGAPRCLACDRWSRVADNIAAIAQHIDALRRIDRYGVGTLEQAFAGYAALPPAPASAWWQVLEVDPLASLKDVERSFYRLAASAHGDRGGSGEAMRRFITAREEARQALAGVSR